MTDAARVLIAANTRLVTLFRRTMWLSHLTAALSLFGFALGMYDQGFSWTGALTGVIVLAAGFTTANTHGMLARLAPEQARRWMLRLAYAMYLGGSLLVGAGLLAGMQRFATR